jgi:hypothetical protein
MPTSARPPSRPDFLFGLLAGMIVILVIALGGMVAWMFLGRTSSSGDRPAPQSAAPTPPVLPETPSEPAPIRMEPLDLKPVELDSDGDSIPDGRDNCPTVTNPDQRDSDGDKSGDSCDEDRDGDGFPNAQDNCPDDPQPDQMDQDRDGKGDVCDETPFPVRMRPRSSSIEVQDAGIAVERMNELEKKLKGFPSDPEKRAQSADEIGPVASESVHVLAAAIRMMSQELDASNAVKQRLIDARKSGMPGLTPEETLRRFKELEADVEAKTNRMKDVCSRILNSAKSLANGGLGKIRPEELGDAIESSGLNDATRELHEKWSGLSERTPKPPEIPSQGEVGAKLKSLAAWLGKLENELK